MKITWKHDDSDFTWPLSLEDKITIFCERADGWLSVWKTLSA